MRQRSGVVRRPFLGGRRLLGLAAPAAALMALLVGVAAPALACGGLIGPNGGVSLLHTTTLVGYHDGMEHYVTAFDFSGGVGNFGSLIPLPAVPASIEKGGAWTLQRLEEETSPQIGDFAQGLSARADAPVPAAAQVLQQTTIGALDITVLKGGAFAVGTWAKDNGFSLPPDAPSLLAFYAQRSEIFLAAKFNTAAAQAQGQTEGSATPIQIDMKVANPWVPLAILTLGKQPAQFVQADIYLLTDRAPSMLPAPTVEGSAQTSANGLTLARSEPASASLLSDLHADQNMGWVDQSGMWLSYLQLDTPAVNLHYDLAVDQSGRGSPSLVAAGLPATSRAVPSPVPAPREPWVWGLVGGAAAVLLGGCAWTWRRLVMAARRGGA